MFVLVCFWCTTNNQENISLVYISKHFLFAHGSADWQRQLCSSLWVKCRSSPCVFLWGPGQLSGFGSMEHVFLMVEGGCSQEASRNMWCPWRPLERATLLLLSNFHWPKQVSWPRPTSAKNTPPVEGGKGKKGVCAEKCSTPLQYSTPDYVVIQKAHFTSQ